ncbi:hypothetical protein H310_15196 [Aphanomyces invadans]|uniref:Uncharacterized protein n=1 Tax=Aphanomyces invadans TaxID=157072 RepID=A0A024T7N5_9STRA|nr:hypothetical protein H310_15196 [Aphanomyces invadans]ETV89965.1 hypothetical protein H310_15196 [Aphanomyces invadans]|eukprot:XP_008881403.1 hypothetical protein H310_15196 [Aphanomyces invadans]
MMTFGRQYQDDTTFAEVGHRLDAAVANLSSHAIFGCIRKAQMDLLDLHRHVSVLDDDNIREESGVDGSVSDSTASSSSSLDSANSDG